MDMNPILTLFLAVWGALLSTFLAVMQFRDKCLKISVSAAWTASEEEGHTIRIRNLSSFSVILTGWEVFYRQPHFFTSQDELIEDSGFDWNDITIKSASTFPLEFKDEYHFSTHKRKNIYIKLLFAGHRAITRLIKKVDN